MFMRAGASIDGVPAEANHLWAIDSREVNHGQESSKEAGQEGSSEEAGEEGSREEGSGEEAGHQHLISAHKRRASDCGQECRRGAARPADRNGPCDQTRSRPPLEVENPEIEWAPDRACLTKSIRHALCSAVAQRRYAEQSATGKARSPFVQRATDSNSRSRGLVIFSTGREKNILSTPGNFVVFGALRADGDGFERSRIPIIRRDVSGFNVRFPAIFLFPRHEAISPHKRAPS